MSSICIAASSSQEYYTLLTLSAKLDTDGSRIIVSTARADSSVKSLRRRCNFSRFAPIPNILSSMKLILFIVKSGDDLYYASSWATKFFSV